LKDYFENKDNVIDKKIMSYIDSMCFSHRDKIKYMIRDLRTFFAEHYTNGSLVKAKAVLEAHNT